MEPTPQQVVELKLAENLKNIADCANLSEAERVGLFRALGIEDPEEIVAVAAMTSEDFEEGVNSWLIGDRTPNPLQKGRARAFKRAVNFTMAGPRVDPAASGQTGPAAGAVGVQAAAAGDSAINERITSVLESIGGTLAALGKGRANDGKPATTAATKQIIKGSDIISPSDHNEYPLQEPDTAGQAL